MTASPVARAWLEALGLEPRLPDGRFLEDLFLLFQRRVACETLTRPAGAPASFDAEDFAALWPDEERGLTGEERARAFAWLAGELGFTCELEETFCSRPWARPARDEARGSGSDGGFSPKVNGEEAHRAVVATLGGRRILADAGFPLPVLVSLDAPFPEIPTGFGALAIREANGDEGLRVTCDARGDVADLLRFRPPPLANLRPGTSPRQEGHKSEEIFALRVLDDRALYWAGGVMTILDVWSRLRYPLAGRERAALESLFALDLDGVDLPEVGAPEFPPVLTVFHAVPLLPDAVRRSLDVGGQAPSPLVAARRADVTDAPGGSRIALTATLGEPVPAAGPGESVRKTLVFHLAMDLLALGCG